jgi:thymidine kinase
MAKLHFYYSAMNAGKTTTLLQSNYNYQERGMETLVLIPATGTRDAKGVISSRIGLTSEAYTFEPSFNLFNFVQDTIKRSLISCVLVDEGHFLTKEHVFQLARIVDELDIPVLVYGLRSDFRGEIFESSKYLLGWAENLTEIKTICHCGRKATMNVRVDDKGRVQKEGAQYEVGGNDRYIALCRKHFMSGETSSTKQPINQTVQKAS